MTSLPNIIEIALLLLVVFLIGCVIGYLARGFAVLLKSRNKDEAQPAAPADQEKEVSVSTSAPVSETPVEPSDIDKEAPTLLDAPRQGTKDNLQQILGIGPKIETTLNSIGVFHFDQIAAWDQKSVHWVDEKLSFKGRIDREKWVQQASALSGNPDG